MLARPGIELIALAHGDQLELQACGFGLGEHARTLQEDKAWLAPEGETPQAADDLVFRA